MRMAARSRRHDVLDSVELARSTTTRPWVGACARLAMPLPTERTEAVMTTTSI